MITAQKKSKANETKLLFWKNCRAYFGLNGSRYNYGRVPIAGSDFSTRPYTYADTKDPTLKSFRLAPEDTLYKIPLMHRALRINPELRFVSAPWTAPPWMKTNDNYSGFGKKLDYLFLFFNDRDGSKKLVMDWQNRRLRIILHEYFEIKTLTINLSRNGNKKKN